MDRVGKPVLFQSTSHFLYPATLERAGCYVIPSVQKFANECLFIRPSVHPSVTVSFQPIFLKLGIRVDIGKECLEIADE